MTIAQIKPLNELMESDWAKAMQPEEAHIRAMGDFLREQIHQGHRILPESRNILRAFNIPLRSIKVLIVGQDPYPTPGHPVGLSFSTEANVHPLPKSLIIFVLWVIFCVNKFTKVIVYFQNRAIF